MKSLTCLISALSLGAFAVQAQDLPGRVENANPDSPVLAPEGAPPPVIDDGEAHGLPHPVVAADGSPQFVIADADGNGVLSIEEAREVLPDLVVVDINSDGLVNHSEAENALPGLQLGEEGERASSDQAVGQEEYALMVQHIADQEARNSALLDADSLERPASAIPRSTTGRGQ